MRRFYSKYLTGIHLLAFLLLSVAMPFSQAQASFPAPEIDWAVVWAHQSSDGSVISRLLATISGPSPEDVDSFTVSGPSVEYALNPASVSSKQVGLYYGVDLSNTIVPNGTYTFELTDSQGRKATAVRDFTYQALPQVDSATMRPENERYVETTTPTLMFDPVSENDVYYQVVVMDYNHNALWFTSEISDQTSVTVPEGLLQPNTPYWWFVRVLDSDSGPQNYHVSEQLAFYTGRKELPNLEESQVVSYPSNGNIRNFFGVWGPPGVAPWDIDYLTVTGPGSTVYYLNQVRCRFYDNPYYFTIIQSASPIPDGDYVFEIMDDEGHTGTANRSFTNDPIPAVTGSSMFPADNAYFNTSTPTFSWDSVSEAQTYNYKVRIWNYRQTIMIYDSPLSTETSATLPASVNLPRGSSYKWQVVSYDANTTAQMNNLNFSQLFTFTINAVDTYERKAMPWIPLLLLDD